MRFVDDDKLGIGFLAPGERLDATHLDGLRAIRAPMEALHDANRGNALPFESIDGLVDQTKGRHGENNAVPLVQGASDNVGGSQRLSESTRRLKERALVAGQERLAKGLKRPFLVSPERAKFAGGS
jgi:hypothetical protein